MSKGTIYAMSISSERGQLKKEVPEANVIENYGIENDGHAGDWGRQIICLNWASVQKANKGHQLKTGPGDFAENILIDGLDFSSLYIGSRIRLGTRAVLEITQIGKEDHPSIVSRTFGVSLLPIKASYGFNYTKREGVLLEKVFHNSVWRLEFNISIAKNEYCR